MDRWVVLHPNRAAERKPLLTLTEYRPPRITWVIWGASTVERCGTRGWRERRHRGHQRRRATSLPPEPVWSLSCPKTHHG